MNKRLAFAAKIITYITLFCFVLAGLVSATVEIQPFWLDEWFIIHNIKFRSADELWGKLEFMQQFPRVYLQMVGWFSAISDFSYWSLRLPSFVVHITGVWLCLRLGRQLYRQNIIAALLWVMIYVAFNTSIHYYVQTKQYTMEMLMGLVAIWQLKSMLQVTTFRLPAYHLAALYLSMAAATFFSYTYPVIIAPVYIVFLYRLLLAKDNAAVKGRGHIVLLLLVNMTSIGIFYLVDVQQVLADQGMQQYWETSLMKDGFNAGTFFRNIYQLFAHIGSGGLFEAVFAICGITGLVLTLYRIRENIGGSHITGIIAGYAAISVTCIIIMFAAGKLPLGVHRLNAFATPALGILVVYLFTCLQQYKNGIPAAWVSFVLLLALVGNVFTSYISDKTDPVNRQKYIVYRAVSKGLEEAQEINVPILADRNITYPNDFKEISGDWVIKTYPAYSKKQALPVYPIEPGADIQAALQQYGLDTAMYIGSDYRELVTLDAVKLN